jgi:PTH1 family peptidyl-tRNA hydrolase
LKYLIAGLGNIGKEYELSRHNIGFMILDALSGASNLIFTSERYASKTQFKYKGKQIILIKPNTYMNLSGKALRYWINQENIPISQLLVIVDDIALPFGTIRIRGGGSNGGHNGLTNIDELLGSHEYARMRFGIGNNFPKGKQADYVLSSFSENELKILPFYIERMRNAVISFATEGLQHCMNEYNKLIEPPLIEEI